MLNILCCGYFQDPQVAIPKGTILSVILTTFSYVIMAVIAGMTVLRDASGDITEAYNGTFGDCINRTCIYGLQNNFQVII